MNQSINKRLGRLRYNTISGQLKRGMFFVFPVVIVSPKKIHNWTSEVFSIYFGWFNRFKQFNFFKEIQSENTEVDKKLFVDMLNFMRENNYEFNVKAHNMKEMVDYLQDNNHIVLLLRNADKSNDYARNILLKFIKESGFFVETTHNIKETT